VGSVCDLFVVVGGEVVVFSIVAGRAAAAVGAATLPSVSPAAVRTVSG